MGIKKAVVVLEHFDCYVDAIYDDAAYIHIQSREHGDVLYGQYPASLLAAKGIGEQDRFLVKTVKNEDSVGIEIESIPKIEVTDEEARAIAEEINRLLPTGDVEY